MEREKRENVEEKTAEDEEEDRRERGEITEHVYDTKRKHVTTSTLKAQRSDVRGVKGGLREGFRAKGCKGR